MQPILDDLRQEFRRHKNLADRALAALGDAEFFRAPDGHPNPAAVIVKHLAGNLRSRWTDFLTSDGEKPDRDRDDEFVITERDSRASLTEAWERGWHALTDSLAGLRESDLGRVVTIRGEGHTVLQALLRALTHAAYHTGQIAYLSRLFRPDSPWLTVPPGQSRGLRGGYFRPPA